MEVYAKGFDRRTRLGLRGRSVLGFAALAVALPFTSWIAHGADREMPTSKAVGFQRQDLADEDEVDRVYAALKSAGHEVCAIYDGGSAESAKAKRQCVDAAVGEAVHRINAPLLTARYVADVNISVHDVDGVTQVASR